MGNVSKAIHSMAIVDVCGIDTQKYPFSFAKTIREIKSLVEQGHSIKFYNNFVCINNKTYNGVNRQILDSYRINYKEN